MCGDISRTSKMSESSNFDSGIFQLTDNSSTDENFVEKNSPNFSSPVKFRTNLFGNISNFFTSSAFLAKNVSESSKNVSDCSNGDVVSIKCCEDESNGECSKDLSENCSKSVQQDVSENSQKLFENDRIQNGAAKNFGENEKRVST